ncbi:MAG: hypothetical protein HONBIEJF_00027 [Fimbriimonadaceae bacterium]|nr:hypothetical protein [Fimbriimonadaceae bacterium]
MLMAEIELAEVDRRAKFWNPYSRQTHESATLPPTGEFWTVCQKCAGVSPSPRTEVPSFMGYVFAAIVAILLLPVVWPLAVPALVVILILAGIKYLKQT